MPRLVAPEHRPTLAELLARRGRATRWAVLAGLAAVAAGAAWGLAPHRGGVHYVHAGAPVFNLRHGAALQPVRTHRGELLRIRRSVRGRVLDTFAVSRLTLPPYRGDVAGVLPVYAERVLAQLRAAHPRMRLVEEGKARVGDVAGYSLLFRVGRGRGRMFGREVLLAGPQPGARAGVRFALRTWKGSGVAEPRALGVEGALRAPYRSFRYGTEDG